MKTEYNVDYFTKKFEAIPDEQWCTTSLGYGGKHCVMGHCGVISDPHEGWVGTAEAEGLAAVLGVRGWRDLWEINDGYLGSAEIKGLETPKARILAALQAVKEGRQLCPS